MKSLCLFYCLFFVNLTPLMAAKQEDVDIIPDAATSSNTDVAKKTEETSRINSSESSLPPKTNNIFIETRVPTFLGLGGELFYKKWSVSLAYGLIPKPYSQLIAQMGADIGGDSSYETLINAGLEENKAYKLAFNYQTNWFQRRLNFSLHNYYVTSKGDGEIDEILSAVTGRNFTTLKNLLIALGRPTTVDLEGWIYAIELSANYNFWSNNNWSANTSLGIVQIISCDTQIKTGLTNFENSGTGQKLLSDSESDIEDILLDNGISPVAGLSLKYSF